MDRPVYKDRSNAKRTEDDFGHCKYVCSDGDLKSEQSRLLTFQKWPTWTGQCPKNLAEAGLSYTGIGDKTRCAFCMGILLHWTPSDEPIREHRRLHPKCPFIQGKYVGNIPLQSGSNISRISASKQYIPTLTDKRYNEPLPCDSENVSHQNTCSVSGNLTRQNICPVSRDVPETSCRVSGNVTLHNMCHAAGTVVPPATCRVSGNVLQNAFRFPDNVALQNICRDSCTVVPKATCVDFSREENRLRSYIKWPRDRTQTIEDLARAGFHHVPTENKPDRVMCAYCKGKLYNWRFGDDPWIEHARCSPKCPYIKLCVGDDIIRDLVS